MWWDNFQGLGDLIQIIILWCAFYYVFRFFRGTRGAQVVVGLAILLAALIGITQLANLDVLSWILRSLTVYFAVALVVIFHPEIRRALAELGKQHPFNGRRETETAVEELVRTAAELSEHRIGALIAIEQVIGTRAIQETGVRLDARLSSELLISIFNTQTPLHDGGVIISGGRALAARCLFPLSEVKTDQKLGTRHRAAIGMSEETDAVVLVVSEETGRISVCHGGALHRQLGLDELRGFLTAHLSNSKRPASVWQRVRSALSFRPDAEPLATPEEGRHGA